MQKLIIIEAGTQVWTEGGKVIAPAEIWAHAEYHEEVHHFTFERNGFNWMVREQDVRVVARQANGKAYGA